MAKIGLSAPWILYYRSVQALFEEDNQVHVILEEGQKILKIYVENENKAAALSVLLPSEKKFGDVTLDIQVVPSNGMSAAFLPMTSNFAASSDNVDLFRTAFYMNCAIDFIQDVNLMYNNTMTYVVFRKKVAQFFTDDLSSYYGIRSVLYEDLAREIFEDRSGVFFCTSKDSAKPSW